MISSLGEEYLSDLNPEEIPNSDISDISESEFHEGNQEMINSINDQESLDLKVEL